jgi:hypothetical protein
MVNNGTTRTRFWPAPVQHQPRSHARQRNVREQGPSNHGRSPPPSACYQSDRSPRSRASTAPAREADPALDQVGCARAALRRSELRPVTKTRLRGVGAFAARLPGTLHERARWRTAAVCRVEVARLISYRDCLRSDFRCLRRPEVSLQGGLAACRGGPSARAKLSSPRSRSRCGIGVILGEDGADLGAGPQRLPNTSAYRRRSTVQMSTFQFDQR